MTEPTAILVVDDNPPMASTLADILSMKGYVARTACSGAEALNILKKEKIHIMLTDVVMPDMNGALPRDQANPPQNDNVSDDRLRRR